MRCIGRAAVSDAFEDYFVYRNLIPMDNRLPSIDDQRKVLGLAPGVLPRKSEPEYARVVAGVLRAARRVAGRTSGPPRLVYVGDTRHSDAAAFRHLCLVTGWPGRAFIGAEDEEPLRVEESGGAGTRVTYANRWAHVAEFAVRIRALGFGDDERTIVIVDLDKTLWGARGRNDSIIDCARREAAYEAARSAGGDAIGRREAFDAAYDAVNRLAFLRLTQDNQDAVAYTAMMIACGLFDRRDLADCVARGEMDGLARFLDVVDARRSALPPSLVRLHEDVCAAVRSRNPTPFVEFRRAEYRQTVNRMGTLPDVTPPESMAREEIVLTAEVWRVALEWKARGALLFGLSDKPDEACLPAPEDAARGWKPVHRTETHVVEGSS